jgi:outer membrane protein OmpA-like peptidoglycan-associated protein
MRKIFKILSLITLISLTGCVVIEPLPKIVVCPTPSQNCKPGKWKPSQTELAVDTSAEYAKFAEYHYKFYRVKNINSPTNEWGLGFIDRKLAALTFDDGNLQRAMLVKFSTDDKALFQSGMGIPIDGSVGSLSIRGKDVVFSAKESEFSIMNPDKSSVAVDSDGKLAFNDAIYPSSDIYTANLKNNILFNVKNISRSLTKDIFNWEAQPAFSPDGNVIFFSSDKPYFNKGVELWFMVKDKNGNWSEPINCGESINSDCDELTPFISADGKKMLFASNGHETVGGYDIFESMISDKLWNDAITGSLEKLKSTNYFTKAKNLRTPLNTRDDELFPSSPTNPDELLYYSSNQGDDAESIILRRGGFDIYLRKKLTKQKPIAFNNPNKSENISDLENIDIKAEVKTNAPDVVLEIPQEYKFRGTVYNAKTKEPVPEADVVVKDLNPISKEEFEKRKKNKPNINDRDFELSSQDEGLVYDTFKTKSDKDGKYKVELTKDREYEITAQAPSLFYETIKLKVEKDNLMTDTSYNFNVPEQLTLRINFPYKVYNNPYKYVLDSNAIETNTSWQEEMELLVKNIKASAGQIKKIILYGHTDDIGGEEYNIKLGLSRVKFIVEELIKRGISSDLLDYSSKGKSEPLIRRADEDINTYRKRLRRVELQKVLK